MLLKVQLLGGLEIRASGEPCSCPKAFVLPAPSCTPAAQARCVVHERQQLAFFLRSDLPEDKAKLDLRVALFELRKWLKQIDPDIPWLTQTASSLLWHRESNLELDVDQFEALSVGLTSLPPGPSRAKAAQERDLSNATEIYGGLLLPEFDDPWIVEERQRLESRYLAVLDRLADILETIDDSRAALVSKQQLELTPTDESAHRRLMRVMARGADIKGVRSQYQACADVLQNHIGSQPSRSTMRLFDLLTDGDLIPGADEKHAELQIDLSNSVDAESPNIQVDGRSHIPDGFARIIGRSGEIAECLTRLERTRLVSIVAAGGTGKTRLAVEVARRAQAQFLDGVSWIDLSRVGVGEDALPEIISVCAPSGSIANATPESLSTFLSDQHRPPRS